MTRVEGGQLEHSSKGGRRSLGVAGDIEFISFKKSRDVGSNSTPKLHQTRNTPLRNAIKFCDSVTARSGHSTGLAIEGLGDRILEGLVSERADSKGALLQGGFEGVLQILKIMKMPRGERTNSPSLIVVLTLVLFAAGSVLSPSHAAFAQDSSDSNLGNVLNGPASGLNPNGQSPDGLGDYDSNGGQYGNQNYGGQMQSGMQSPQGSYSRGADLQPSLDSQDLSSARRNMLYREQSSQQALRNLPPEPPTEFQKMVAGSTGKLLPIFGAQLFRGTPSTFSPLDRVPVTPDYVIGPGDELLLQIWGQVRLNSHFIVDRAGSIYIPQVGTVEVSGLSFGQLRDFLKTQIGRTFRNFDLNVNMGQLRSIQVFVVGQARRPGSYTLSSLSTLVDALFVTGGPSPQGTMRHIQVKRAGKVVTDFDLYALLEGGDKSKDIALLPGDVIYIPPVGAQVAVAGNVNLPAIYELQSEAGTTVDQVLELAAGPTNIASNETVRLERVDAHLMRSIKDLSLDSAGRKELMRDGDILEVVAIIDRFKNGVTLRGNVANPGQYSWHSGMRVSELFPDKDALITRDYWLKRGQLGKPTLTYVPVCPLPVTRQTALQPLSQNGVMANNMPNGMGNGNSSQSYDPLAQGYYSQREQPTGSPDDTELKQDEDGRTCIILPESMRQGGQNLGNNARATNGNTQLQNLQDSNQSQSQRSAPVANGFSAASAMVGEESDEFKPRNDVKLSEPDIDWTYAVIERQNKSTLTTSLLPFNLGGIVLQKDNSQDLPLEPGDVVTIFSKADFRVPQTQQTRLVHLEGEFRSAGVYSVLPGETLKDLVKRAGGFTPDAYLYGSEFTRESTRRVQQQRLNEYVNQIALQAGTSSANNASRAVSALDTAAAAAMASQSQSVINSLRQARSSGRIVLELRPDSDSVDQLPAIPLEDGDRFVVPHVPSTVSVAGAVYNANSFIYDQQRRLKDYMQLAGGSNRDADKKSIYVIRADGSVVSRRQISNWHKDSFDSLRVFPGDTVVIPLNLSKGAGLRTVVDIAQIVGQFGVAIAAANLVF